MTDQLQANLRQTLPAGQVKATPLPGLPIALWLLDEASLSAPPLGPEAMARVLAAPAYWAFCWASGQALAAHILANPESVRGARVLDFGAGSGVVAIAAARAGAAEVWVCDNDPMALAAAQANAALNQVSVNPLSDLAEAPTNLDVAFAADVLYDAENWPLLDRLAGLAAQVLVADSRVRDARVPGFVAVGSASARTWPDLGEPEAFNRVVLFSAQGCPPAMR